MDQIIQALSNNGFAWADYAVFAIYIVILVGLGMFLSRGKKGQEKSSADYFLAGNTLTWWAVECLTHRCQHLGRTVYRYVGLGFQVGYRYGSLRADGGSNAHRRGEIPVAAHD